MDMNKLETTLGEIFGQQNVRPYLKGFRIIINYENKPYCIILKNEDGHMVLEKDAIEVEDPNYEEAYKKAYKIFIQNKDKLGDNVVI
jgi:hypothetical protein